MKKKMSINEFIESFELLKGDYYGFFDWFCTDRSLKNRAKSMIPKIKFLMKHKIINGDTTRVYFKNHCPVDGDLYDSMFFSTTEGNESLGGVVPSLGHNIRKGICEVWLDEPYTELRFENWMTFRKAVLANENLLKRLQDNFYRE